MKRVMVAVEGSTALPNALEVAAKGYGVRLNRCCFLIIAALAACLAARMASAQPLPWGSVPPPAPPQAANAGFVFPIFDDDFSTRQSLIGDLSCAGTPQTAPWKQGLWWEGQTNPAGVAPCNQISIVSDPVFGTTALDLKWLPSQTDAFDATSISTYPLDDASPHFAFTHGYVEVVARVTPFVSGVWPTIWLWSDESVRAAALPPNYTSYLPASEMDIAEFFGPGSASKAPQGGEDGCLHEYYSTPVIGFTSDKYPPGIDPTKSHIYGWLWTAGPQWQGGKVCQYIDNSLQGCASTSAASEAQSMFLILSMAVGCNYSHSDRSCVASSLTRADLLVQRVTVYVTLP